MLHSGSRGVGNRIGTVLHRAREEGDASARSSTCPTRTSPTCREGTDALRRLRRGRRLGAGLRARRTATLMMEAVLAALRGRANPRRSSSASRGGATATTTTSQREHHFGEDVLVTRKGAVRARRRRARDHPGQHGARSRSSCAARATPSSFHSCSHGAGRAMSPRRGEAALHLEDHVAATAGVECRKDADVIDETPGGLQGHRRRDGGAGRPRRGRPHAEAGRLREGLTPSPAERRQCIAEPTALRFDSGSRIPNIAPRPGALSHQILPCIAVISS